MERKRFEINEDTPPRKTFEIQFKPRTYTDDTPLSEVEAIEEGMVDIDVINRPIESLVEYPLLEAVRKLNTKGIKTHASSANKKDLESGEVYIIIYFDSLNDNNKKVAEQFYIYEQQYAEKIKLVKISVPANPNSTVGDVKKDFNEVVSLFENQQ